MTLVISEEESGRVVMGADSAAGSADEIHVFPELEKIVQQGPYLVGHAGRGIVGQALSVLVEWPEPPASDDLLPFLVREVVPEIRRAVQEIGAAQEGPLIMGDNSVLLIGLRGQLWVVGADLYVIKSPGLSCIGAGRAHAYAAMKALKAAGVGPARKRIELTLEAAAEECSVVRPPFRFLEM